MKNTAKNSLSYTGVVTLSQSIGNKKFEIAKVHNSGGSSLFDFLSDCLVGDYDIAKAKQPKKIKLLKYNEESGNHESVSGYIQYTTKPERVYENPGSTVRYSFIVSRAMLESYDDFDRIGLYANSAGDNDIENFAAYCEVPFSSDDISNSAILVIDWELNISNRNS